jgi:alkanesulfonate monooxygenase SsuD/methylene tetrahydromethanopterin reductase-like flavin-dependent oxidoreductase (luciferase family)
MKFGIFIMPEDPPAGSHIRRRWEEVLEEAVAAEAAGFDSCFLPEHHFRADGFCTSPLVALAAIAARTKKLRLGTATIILPAYHPIRLAEDAALLDILSGGRLLLGVGLGDIEAELRVFGVERKERLGRFMESLEVIRRAWSEDRVSFEGKHFRFSDVAVNPKPVQQPGPPIFMGAMSEPGVKRAGGNGLGWLTDPLRRCEVLAPWRQLYVQTCREHDHQPQVMLFRDAWLGENIEEVEREWWPYARQEYWGYVSQLPKWMAEADPWLKAVRSPGDLSFAVHRADRLVVGGPGDVIATLKQFASAVGTDYVILRLRLASGPPHQETLRCIERFGREVISVMGKAGESA